MIARTVKWYRLTFDFHCSQPLLGAHVITHNSGSMFIQRTQYFQRSNETKNES